MVKTINWGTDWDQARIFEVSNNNGIIVRLSDLGSSITSIITPDRYGELDDITLGYDTPAEYIANDAYFGATVGRYANRIANAKFTLNGVEHHVTRNEGENSLHGGGGFHKRLWHIKDIYGDGLTMALRSGDGDCGFPGNLTVDLEARLTNDNILKLEFSAVSDKDTIINLTNHTYFNLAGSGDVLGHEARINADYYTPVDSSLIPTGELLPVEGTDFDFRTQRPIKYGFYDHNFVLNKEPYAVFIAEPKTGRTLTVRTSMPGLQFYCGKTLSERKGRDGATYKKYSGLCLEPQYFPNTPNTPSFPSCVIKANEVSKQYITYEFGTF